MKRLKLESSSGCEKWDKKAIAAVQAAQPFGRMPFDYRRDVLFVRMEFKSGPPVTYTFIGPSMLGRIQGRISQTRFLLDNNVRHGYHDVFATLEALDEEEKKSAVTVSAQGDVDFGPYMASLQRRIKGNLTPVSVSEDMRVVVVFRVMRNGRVTNLRLVSPSSSKEFNDSAIAAVTASNPFRPLPEGAPSEVDIQFTFDMLSGSSIDHVYVEVFPFAVPKIEKQLYDDEYPEEEFKSRKDPQGSKLISK